MVKKDPQFTPYYFTPYSGDVKRSIVLSWTLLMTSCTHVRVRAVIVPDLKGSSSRKNLKN